MPFAPRPVARRAVRWVFSPKLEVHRHVTSACVISGVADPRRGGVRTEKSIHIDLGGSRLTGLTGCRSDPCYQLGPAVTCMFKKFWPFGLATRMHRRRTRRQFSHICDTRDKGLAYARACISCDRAQIGEMGSNSHLMVAAKLRRHNRAARRRHGTTYGSIIRRYTLCRQLDAGRSDSLQYKALFPINRKLSFLADLSLRFPFRSTVRR
jgi:hypothetical protein